MNTLSVTISTPDEQIWQGTATSVSSENSAGAFDILAQHANFVTIVGNKPIVIRGIDGGDTKEFQYKTAIISVKNDKVNIYSEV